MKKVILAQVFQEGDSLSKFFAKYAKEIRKMFTDESHIMVNVVVSDYKNPNLRQVSQILKCQNFYVKNQRSYSGNRENFLKELCDSVEKFDFTLGIMNFPMGGILSDFNAKSQIKMQVNQHLSPEFYSEDFLQFIDKPTFLSICSL